MEKIKKIAHNTYQTIKEKINKSFSLADYISCLNDISILAKFAYYNCLCYSDSEIESYLKSISDTILPAEPIVCKKNKWVLYDAYFRDNAVLTEQYIKAFLSYDIELLIVCEVYNPQKAGRILSLIDNNPKVKLFVIDQNKEFKERLCATREAIANFHPDKVFIQIYPWSVDAVVLCNSLKGIDRYFINATDHSFWLGTNCTDYTLEFREMGCTISREKRNIPSERILLNTFYAAVGENYRYDGFPPGVTAENIVLMSGGGLYKAYDSTWTFFSLIKRILDENPRTVLLFPGLGEKKPFVDFITKNNFEDRIFLLGHRQDIYQLIKNSDIYLNTYPLSGGLMCHIAAHYKKPIVAYRPESNKFDLVEYFLGYDIPTQITYFTIDDYASEVKKLCNNLQYRKEKGEKISNGRITEKLFGERLLWLVSNNCDDRPHVVSVDYTAEQHCYLENEKNVFFNTKILLKKYRVKSLFLFPDFMAYYLPKYIYTLIKTKIYRRS